MIVNLIINVTKLMVFGKYLTVASTSGGNVPRPETSSLMKNGDQHMVHRVVRWAALRMSLSSWSGNLLDEDTWLSQ